MTFSMCGKSFGSAGAEHSRVGRPKTPPLVSAQGAGEQASAGHGEPPRPNWRTGTMNAGFSPQIQSYRRFGFPPIGGSPESAGKTSMVHGKEERGRSK